MNVDDEARAPSANSTFEDKQSGGMSVDRFPENGVTSGTAVAKETVVSRLRPNYHAKFILSGHAMSISSLKFSPDGSLLASSGAFITPVLIE